MERRKHPKLEFWVRVAWAVIVPLTSALFRRRYRGTSNVPASGPVIIALNHVSYVDPLLTARWVYDVGRVPRFLAKSGLFTAFLVGPVLRGARQIPVYRGSAEAGESVQASVEALRAGECVVFYPEGTVTRDPDWWPMLAKTGVARVALASGAPVIPVAQWGAQNSVNWYARRFRPVPRKDVTLSAGPPVDLANFAGAEPTAAVLREVTDTIMAAVRDQLADIRREMPPEQFYRRPAARRTPGEGPA
ncbi:MAG: 1-acyl-sn-glycerol-3-phosphate acyltransferase [Actinobacteria bacterium]|nr:1-acyl-sn-glycerol-3-phosphate acyltransferase [Actinomycetota bacterium]